MDIRTRTIAAVSLVIFLLTALFLVQGISQHNQEINDHITHEQDQIDTIIGDITTYALTPYLSRIKHLTESHPEMIRAFAERDRQRLYGISSKELAILRAENPYFHALDFNLPDGTVFLRTQEPELAGDNILASRPLLKEVHANHATAAGFDIGKHGAMYWIAQPLFFAGKYVGAMEFGIPVRQLTDAIGQRLHTEVATVWDVAPWQKAVLVNEGFRTFSNSVLIDPDTQAFEQLPDNFDFTAAPRQRVEINGRTNLLHVSTVLRDYQGRIVGKILVLQDISGKVLHRRNFIVRSVLISALLLCVALGVVFLATRRLIGRLEECAAENRRAREEIQHAHDALEVRVTTRTSELATANATLRDEVAERLATEQKLEKQRQFLQGIIESLTHPFYVIDVETRTIVLANKAAYALTDRPHEGLTCHAMTHGRDTPCTGEEHVCALSLVRETGRPAMVEHFHCDHADGSGGYFEIHAYPLFDEQGKVKQVIEYNIDITERKKAEEERKAMWAQLLQSQKMEAVGVLAGGVAHDFNNILTAIIGNAQLAMLKADGSPEAVRKHLEQIMGSSNRAVGLVRQLLLFSRRPSGGEYGPVDINKAVQSILVMLQRLIGEDITVSVEATPGIWPVNTSEGCIEQMVTNLVVNARDAMPEGGKIVIATKNLGIDENLEKQIHNSRLGNYVVLSVADTGIGIPKENLPQIFDPFYTTKSAGKGTGLGLSIVSGIVAQHDGWVNVYSDLGRGTIFNIYLPANPFPEEESLAIGDAASQRRPPVQQTALAGGGRTVLLLEDEADVREVALRILEEKGFRVIAASDIDTARAIFGREGDALDLLFSDVALPDGNGVKLAQELLALSPGLKVLMTSGYPDHRSRLEMIREKKLHFIQKPYGVSELEQALAATLEE